MKSDRDRDMTQQSGSGQHSQQSDRKTDANGYPIVESAGRAAD